jgi:TM2 domain-containing membrane protein YozV
MQPIIQLMPFLEGEEMVFIQGLIKDMTEEQVRTFVMLYTTRRKDPQTIMLTACLGFIGLAGIQRFILGQIGMGILYLFTGGICLIGTIVDIASHKKLTLQANQKIAQDVAFMAGQISA